MVVPLLPVPHVGCWLLQGCPPLRWLLRVYALLLADHRLCLLGSPWFDPDAKPRSCFMLVCLFASPGPSRIGRGAVQHSL